MSDKLANFGLVLTILLVSIIAPCIQNQVQSVYGNGRGAAPLGYECWTDTQCQTADPNSACMNINWVTGWGQCGCINGYEENKDGVCDGGLSTGAIVGIIIGSFVGCVIIAVIILIIVYKCSVQKGHSIKWDVPAGDPTPIAPVASSRPKETTVHEHKDSD